MSTQTGIEANSDLLDFFSKAKSNRYRLIKVVITKEELALDEAKETGGDWERDWDQLIGASIDANEPCYLFYRMDEVDSNGNYKWLFISWSPDTASVRNKMLYSSTKATLKRTFGSGLICGDLFGSHREDVTLAGYRRYLAGEKAPKPLTREEEERAEVKATEDRSDISVDTRHQTVRGLAFPMSHPALKAVADFRECKVNYVQLRIAEETVELSKSEDVAVNDLPQQVPEDQPRYHLFRFRHAFEGQDVESLIFIYSMPGYDCSIRERMLYSSNRNALVDQIGVTFDKRLEVDSGAELTEQHLLTELHPNKEAAKSTFGKPAPPGGRRRMVRVPPTSS